QQVLDTITFDANNTNATNGGADPSRTISWVLNDGSGASNTSAPQTETVSILAGPAISVATSASYTENGTAVTLSTGVALSDSNAAPLNWAGETSIPAAQAVSHEAADLVGTKLYAIDGVVNGSASAQILVYDTASASWHTDSQIDTTPRYGLTSTVDAQ